MCGFNASVHVACTVFPVFPVLFDCPVNYRIFGKRFVFPVFYSYFTDCDTFLCHRTVHVSLFLVCKKNFFASFACELPTSPPFKMVVLLVY